MTWGKGKIGLTLLLMATAAAGASEKAKPDRRNPVRTDAYGDPLPPGAIARLGTVRLRHPGGARAVSFSPDGKILASGGRDCIVRLWDPITGKELHRLKGHQTWVQSLAFTPDGKILASGTTHNDQLVILWEVASGKEIRRLPGHRNGTPGLAFSPDGKRLVTAGGDHILRVRETSTGNELWHVKTDDVNGIGRVACSPDGRLLISTGALKPRMRVWDAATGKELYLLQRQMEGAGQAIFAPDGKRLLTVNADETVRLWEIATGKELWRSKVKEPVSSLTFASDGKTIALGILDGLVRIWDATTGKELRQIQGSKDIHPIALAPDGKTLAGAGRTIRLWDPQTGKDLFPPRGPQDDVNVLGFAPDDKTVTSVSLDDTVRVWDVASGKELRRTGGMKALFSTPTFTPDGRLLLLERRVGEVRLWDVTAGTEPRRFKVVPPKDPFHAAGGGGVHAAALTSDGKRVAAHDADGTVRVWDAGTGKELCRIKPNVGGGASLILFAPDGETLAVHDGGFTLRLFDVASGKELRRLKVSNGPAAAMAFAPDGKTLIAPGIGSMDLWDIARGERIYRLRLPGISPFFGQVVFAPGGRTLAAFQLQEGFALWDARTGKVLGQFSDRKDVVCVLAFAPNGRTLALAMQDHTVRLWDAFTGQEIRRFHGHQDIVSAVAFTADGRRLASGSWDGTGLIWDLTGGMVAKSLDARELQALWDDLGGTDAPRADRAFWTLAAAPKQTVPLLHERLTMAKPTAAPDLNRLIADLDDDRFAVREKAEKELTRLAERAEPALRRALDREPPLEVRRRIERLLVRLERKPWGLEPLAIRERRAVRILEQINTREARELLETLAVGAEAPALASEARAALLRCERRRPAKK
jgi:WD40 repeat protein